MEKELTKQGQVGKNDQMPWLLDLDNETDFNTQIVNRRTGLRSEFFPCDGLQPIVNEFCIYRSFIYDCICWAVPSLLDIQGW